MTGRAIAQLIHFAALCSLALACTSPSLAQQKAPIALQTDNLVSPLGLDDTAPHFSWQLVDPRHAARQTAYQIQIATKRELLVSGKPEARADIWDSGKILSGDSVGVAYPGPPLAPTTRYYWRVLAWDKEGTPYPPSQIAWWETGLLDKSAWKAKWIGYQTWSEAAVRAANASWIATPDGAELTQTSASSKASEEHVAYRFPFTLDKAVRQVLLFVTGQDVASAWLNGVQIATGAPLPPWRQFPWKIYAEIDATPQARAGRNTLAIQITHYILNPGGGPSKDTPPMSATIAVQYQDGSVATFASAPGSQWRVSIHPDANWTAAIEEDASWKPAVAYVQRAHPMIDLIDPPGDPWPSQSVKALRHDFVVHKPIASARLYATALGAYQVFLNGKRAGDQILSPGWTDFRLRLKYQTYDVAASLVEGVNAIGALVAPGWYSTPLGFAPQPNAYGGTPPSLKAELRIEYKDGTVDWVATDQSWQAAQSPILKAEIYDGETQDARLIQSGWNTANFAAPSGDKTWKPVEVRTPDLSSIALDGQDFPPIRVERTLTPKGMTQPKPGIYIYDMGQNFSGVEHLRLQGPAGTEVQVRTGEILNPDGTLYTENLRTAKSTDHFVLAGKGAGRDVEEFQPQFTYHGFRYLEISGLPGRPLLNAVEGVVFHTDAPFTAQLKTGSPLINQLWQNILWGQRSNFVGVPTDCPQRDERLGWMADAQVFWRAAAYNMNLTAFSRKYTADIRGTQVGSGDGPGTAGALFGIFAPGVSTTSSELAAGWSDAGIIIPWTSWQQTGDTTVLIQNWDAMTKYLAAIENSNPDRLWINNAGIPFGDWLSPEGPTQFSLVATAFWAYDVTLMRQLAHALGKPEDEVHYAQLFTQIKTAFIQAFVHEDGFIAGADMSPSSFGVLNNPNAKAKNGDTQAGYVLALHMNLLPDNLRAAAAQKLVDKIEANHGLLGTGFLGTPYLLAVLTESGHRDLAYKLLLNTDYPSWGYLVDHGATTMWERWNGDQMRDDPSMNSYNHYAYGAVADWIYRYAAGIDTTSADAGFHTIYLHPTFDTRLGSIDLTYDSPYGPIHSAWTVQNGTAKWELTIPANTTGWLPLDTSQAANYKLSGQPIQQSKLAEASIKMGESGFILPAGNYHLEIVNLSKD
jgi:alpha-L-rhamnosidase